jgi:hypothetical protein
VLQKSSLLKRFGGIVLCLGMAMSAYGLATPRIGAVTPAAGSFQNQRTLALTAQLEGHASRATITVDGSSVPTVLDAATGRCSATVSDLTDGVHHVDLVVDKPLGLGAEHHAWSFTVDRKPPVLSLSSPRPHAFVRSTDVTLSGKTKPETHLAVSVDHQPAGEATADASGQFSIPLHGLGKRATIDVRALDRAGNKAFARRSVVCDLTAPTIEAAQPAEHAVLKDDPQVTLQAMVRETGSGLDRVELIVNGKPQPVKLPPTGGPVRVTLHDLPEGACQAVLEATDRAGWVTRHEWNLLVDTTETFGLRPMREGAVGHDVEVLQRKLVARKLLPADAVTKTYDERTVAAIKQLESKKHLTPDGVCGSDCVVLLSPRIYIDLSHFRLQLIDQGRIVKTYGIACGMPGHDTPTGHFHVVNLVKDPTWYPPKFAAWAKDAKIVPPGPNNPLGTRWIGLDSAAVGIHGTPMAWSIGSRASHGCIRMRISDVEDLFNRVNAGVPVEISEHPDATLHAAHKPVASLDIR